MTVSEASDLLSLNPDFPRCLGTVSPLFPDVIRCMRIEGIDIKKSI